MGKILGIWLAFVLLIIFGYFTVISLGVNAVQEENAESNELVGEHVLLKDDTLMIVDQSFFNNTYTLENGKEISKELGEKLLIKKEND
jgi:hypothetical protein